MRLLKEWSTLQRGLLDIALVLHAAHTPALPLRVYLEKHIAQQTQGRARIWWSPYPSGNAASTSLLIELAYRHHSYGLLELREGYLVSRAMPGIPQHFANLCALLIALSEHEAYLHHQLAHLPAMSTDCDRLALTERECDVLKGLARGEDEREMAMRLNLAQATVHKHIQRLYNRLNVHSAQQAVSRAFALRLVDWLD